MVVPRTCYDLVKVAKKNPKQWKKSWIVGRQLKIRAELEEVRREKGTKARLHRILTRIVELSEDLSPSGKLDRYIFCMSALVHHLNFGGLGNKEVQQLEDVAVALLRAQGISSRKSSLSFLHGDLHLVLAQIFRKGGDSHRAGWHQNLAFYHSRTGHAAGPGPQYLALGIEKARLGHSNDAIRFFDLADGETLDSDRSFRSQVERIKVLRLSGNLDESRSVAMKLLAQGHLSKDRRLEVEWEILCINASQSGDIAPLVSAVQRGKSHHLPIYIVEAFVWTRICETKKWITQFPSIGQIAWKMKKDLKKIGIFYECAVVLQSSYQSQIPIDVRIKQLESVIFRVPQVATLEKELQLWGAFARWLLRSNIPVLSEFFLSRYRALSLVASNGTSTDVLRLFPEASVSFLPTTRKSA